MTAQRVYQMIKEHLDNRNFHYESDDANMHISLTAHGKDLPQPTHFIVDEKRMLVRALSPIPTHIPEDKRMEGAVAVCVANHGLPSGCFEMDMSDGEVLFRISQTFRGAEFSAETIDFIVNVCFFTTDRYNDRFFMLANGMMSLGDFIQKEQE